MIINSNYRISTYGALLFLLASTVSVNAAWSQVLSEGRDRMPVVIKGEQLAPWVGSADIAGIYLYAYDSSASGDKWRPIPFQIDKRRKVNVVHFLGDKDYVATGLPLTLPFGDVTDICVYSYFEPDETDCDTFAGEPGTRECRNNYLNPFRSPILRAKDEVVFMAQDMGDQDVVNGTADPIEWLDPLLGNGLLDKRLEIMVADDVDEDGTIDSNEKHWVYAYYWQQLPPPSGEVSSDVAPSFSADQSPDPCPDPEANANNVFRGLVTGNHSSNHEGYKFHFSSNWIMDGFQITETGGTTHDDVLEAFDFAATFEGPMNWDCNLLPRSLGIVEPLAGQVRFIRGVQGSQSGFATIKYEKAYNSMLELEIELRVHDLDDLTSTQKHSPNVRSAGNATIWTATSHDSSDTWYDRINTTSPPTNPNGFDDWHQFVDDTLGATASYTYTDKSRGPIDSSLVAHSYDDVMSDGAFGTRWDNLSCMQDGFDELALPGFGNDGGCGPTLDPESPELLFKRIHRVVVPGRARNEDLKALVEADDWEYAATNPLTEAQAGEQCLNPAACSGGGSLCAPTLSLLIYSDGSAEVDASPDPGNPAGCIPTVASGYAITRQIGSGTPVLIGQTGQSGVFRDARTQLGQAHTYRAVALSSDGSVSAPSNAVTGTPLDTEPPPPLIITSATSVPGGFNVNFQSCVNTEAFGGNLYASDTSGGPYTKVNLIPLLPGGPKSYTVTGLQPGQTYYLVGTLTDFSGNESSYSAETVVTAGQ